jgi:predicted peptidase
MLQQAGRFETDIVRHVTLDYLLHLPPGYGEVEGPWPMIYFLHGAGERGDDVTKLLKHGIPKIVERDPEFPFIALSPQCPQESWWPLEVEALHRLLEEIVARYDVDERRIYLTGISMGGYGSWRLGSAYPERFAAVVPICGGMEGPAQQVCALKEVPVWAFHGAKDPTVPLAQSERLVEALEACGGDVRLTVYPEAAHDSWTETYDNPELYRWLLAQSR